MGMIHGKLSKVIILSSHQQTSTKGLSDIYSNFHENASKQLAKYMSVEFTLFGRNYTFH